MFSYKKYSQNLKVLSAGVIGNSLEFYDYSLYGFFITILSKLFFPNENEILSLLYSLCVFFTGFIARPLGSLILGYMGDRYGRHRTYPISILLMAMATFAISILPTYSQIGIFAPLLLILCRLVQGFSAGGEYITSFVFTLEHTRQDHKGFIGSIVGSAQTLGFIFGTIAYNLTIQTANPDLNWRYPFFLGSLLGLVGLFVRISLRESPEYQAIKRGNDFYVNPVVEAYKISMVNILALGGLTFCLTGVIYTIFMYSPIFFGKLSWPPKTITLYSLYGQVACMTTALLSGYLSDIVNRKTIMISALFVGAIFISSFHTLLFEHNINSLLLFYLFVGLVLGGCVGPWCALVNDSFPIAHKLCGISLGFSFVQAIVGGLTPLILETLILYTGNFSIFFYFLIICFVVGFFSLMFMQPCEVTPFLKRKVVS